MKTKLLFLAFIMLGFISVGQVSFLPPAYVPNATTAKLDKEILVNTMIYVGALHVPYICKKGIGGNMMTMTQAITNGYISIYSYSMPDSTYLHSTGVEKAYGGYTFYSPSNVFYGSFIGTVTGNATSLLTRDTTNHWYSIATRYWAGQTFAPITGSSAYWAMADTGANKYLAAYYTTNTAIALKWAKTDTGAYKALATYYDLHHNYAPLSGASMSNLTVSDLPSCTIAAGTATPTLLADTVNTHVSGLTSGAIILCSYAGVVGAVDSNCFVKTVKAGNFTLQGKHGIPINYWIPKK